MTRGSRKFRVVIDFEFAKPITEPALQISILDMFRSPSMPSGTGTIVWMEPLDAHVAPHHLN